MSLRVRALTEFRGRITANPNLLSSANPRHNRKPRRFKESRRKRDKCLRLIRKRARLLNRRNPPKNLRVRTAGHPQKTILERIWKAKFRPKPQKRAKRA